jgi:hypothetical protein
VTPFDPVALLAMLLSFYAIINGSELARARRERPEYFAGGTLLGSKGDKLRLPDGRMFDLIQNAGGAPGQQRWQVIEVGPGTDERWPLEPGPLTPIDVGVPPTPPGERTTFEALVADAIGAIGGSDAALQSAATRISDGALSTPGAGGDNAALGDAAEALDRQVRARGAFDVSDDIAQLGALADSITGLESENADPPPAPAIPNEPVPASYPGDDGTSGEPGRENPRHPDLPGDDDDTTHRGPHE